MGSADTLAQVRELLTTRVRVVVRGVGLDLVSPPVEDAARLRREGASQSAGKPWDDMTPDERDAVMESGSRMATGAIRLCIPGLDEESAGKLLQMSGGEAGRLCQEAMSLCGLREPPGGDDEADADRPT